MRNRLIELIDDFIHNIDVTKWYSEEHDEGLADYLLKNGVICPPCNVGDTVYIPWEYAETNGIAFFVVTSMVFDDKKPYIVTNFESDDEIFSAIHNHGVFCFDDFGKTVFLTKEEAEKVLKWGTVYEFFDVRGFYSINEFIVENIIIGINPPKCDLYCKSKKGNIKEIFHIDSFGKTLFFSKGKAEQAKEKALKGGA